MDSSKELFGIQVDFNSGAGKLMSKELMIFAAEEYDAGASLHIIKRQPTKCTFNGEERCNPLIFKFQI
jgi:hypothetical protein